MPKLGIDFGTTNSLAVAYDKKEHQFHYFNYIGSKVVPAATLTRSPFAAAQRTASVYH